jgi:hypothetical protein
MTLTMRRIVLILFGVTVVSVVSSDASVITPLNGWIKYACTAENIKVRSSFLTLKRNRKGLIGEIVAAFLQQSQMFFKNLQFSLL